MTRVHDHRDARSGARFSGVEVAVHYLAVVNARLGFANLYCTGRERVTCGMVRADLDRRRATHVTAVVRTVVG
jgi:hypothetical protein